MPKIKSINAVSPDGTCLQGYLNATYQKIVDRYGSPIEGDGYKTDAEWIIKWDDGIVRTIYNWKNGKNYLGESGLPIENITQWNIGGNKKIVEKRINDDILNAWPVFDEIRQEVSE